MADEQQLLYKPEDAAAVLGIGRSKVFELMATGALESVQIGRSRRVPRAACVEYVERLRKRPVAVA
jgi:excisionase family DNA binding protein